MSETKSLYFTHLREKSGLSIKELADRTGRSLRTIYRWENGEIQPDKIVVGMLSQIAETANANYSSMKPKFTFIDLFAGIGGMRLGFESVGGKCVFTSEWNKYSRQTYQANFPIDHQIEGDITKIPLEIIPNHDILLAGFPCQPFSIAGVSKKNSLGLPHGFLCETQGTLFFEIERILEYHRPSAFVLENVKNLLNHDKGNTFRVIENTLVKKLGYHVQWRIINAKSLLPQNRERIFIVGFREKNNFDFSKVFVPSVETGPKLSSILHPEDGSEMEEFPYTVGEKAYVADKYTLSEHLWNYLQVYANKHKELGHGFGFGIVDGNDVSRTLSARYHKDGSEILVKQNGKRPRRLTPRECSRLMGFDRFKESNFIIPVSDTQAYHQFGNAVAVPVVELVAKAILPFLGENVLPVSEEIDQFILAD
ncbi:MAG: DNA (cytosine-5-)-methyltransferase [Chloroflexi bacterium HGW-Chloroflexi-5]|jgi:DNA (cytosine-5)-methyltransferase 1|nr:MAG: DNA (cytosine-5-)-methyltransferase [Chloroflexi bacterium HGW-Chloroflexi-5]